MAVSGSPRAAAAHPGKGRESGYPVIATKLYPPRLRQAPVSREALLGRLDEAMAVPLTLVVAPAGWGKSTLVAQCLDRASVATGWVCIDRPTTIRTASGATCCWRSGRRFRGWPMRWAPNRT